MEALLSEVKHRSLESGTLAFQSPAPLLTAVRAPGANDLSS